MPDNSSSGWCSAFDVQWLVISVSFAGSIFFVLKLPYNDISVFSEVFISSFILHLVDCIPEYHDFFPEKNSFIKNNKHLPNSSFLSVENQ